MICEVIPEKRTALDKKAFSYLVSDELKKNITVGSIVSIPFNKKNIRGVVANLQLTTYNLQLDYKLKEIISIDDNFSLPKEYIEIAKWIAEYYLCSLGEAISLFLPPNIKNPRSKFSNLRTTDNDLYNVDIKLSSDQKEVFKQLVNKLSTSNQEPILLHGVTGSGKTEIYIKLTEEILRRKQQVVVLTPEIMLTPQLVERFEMYFFNKICLMHSGLSKSERYNCYKEFSSGAKPIIIGPRSALLVPNNNIGLIIIDEEQEDAYKQEKDPRYHVVDLAVKIAKKLDTFLLLGSATPRIETYYKCKGNLLELKNRYQKLILPPAKIVDLKDEIKKDNFSPISVELKNKIVEILKKKKQTILFLNRRGMSTFVSCRECGEVINCPRCSIPLVYHVFGEQNILNCHHCDYKSKVPAKCPNCGSTKIKFFGIGIDKIEKEVIELFPKARIKKIDSKSLQKKNDYMKLYDDLKNHQIDILIGTQILAKGLDISNVDLVGIISADTGLHLPFYKAGEKVFSLITQVSGRSGRKNNVGQTIIQTYWPDSPSIRLAALHDYHTFYENEIVEREKYNYPPFCHLVRVISEDRNEQRAKKEIDDIANKLRKNNVDFIGPAKCFLSKINNRYRYHLIIKIKTLPDSRIAEAFKINPYLVWDVDPVDLL